MSGRRLLWMETCFRGHQEPHYSQCFPCLAFDGGKPTGVRLAENNRRRRRKQDGDAIGKRQHA